VRGLEHDLAYRGLAAGDLDAIDVYTTDAEIEAQHLVLLDDDAAFFPRYDAVLVYRAELQRSAPAVIEALRRLEGRISAPRMAAMNARAKLAHVPEAEVAAAFVRDTLGVQATAEHDGPARRITARTLEHLWMVGLSLLLGILVAVPSGWRRRAARASVSWSWPSWAWCRRSPRWRCWCS
jgi:osmoprotectant transport system permease protein